MFVQYAVISTGPEVTFHPKVGKVIVQKASLVSYSSSAPGAECIAFEGPLAPHLNTTVTEKGECFALLYPFTTMEPREDPMWKGLETIVAAEDTTGKNDSFLKRGDPGFWEVDPKAPFVHRITGSLTKVSEEDLTEAIYEHSRRDKIFDFSEGITIKRFPLEDVASKHPIRFVLSFWVIPI